MQMDHSPLDVAWAAGLFEGEGCITPRAKTSGELVVGMTDLDVVERFHGIMGVGTITTEVRNPPHSTCYRWQVTNAADCTMVLNLLLPWLCNRRKAAAEALLERMEDCRGARADRTHCNRGHEYTEANTRWVYGSRRCRACEKISNDRYFAAKKLERSANAPK